MPMSASLKAEAQAFVAAIALAQPVKNATPILAALLKRQGATLLADIDAELITAAGMLDGEDPATFPGDFGGDLLALSDASDTQAQLADLRGLVGRMVLNLNQVGV